MLRPLRADRADVRAVRGRRRLDDLLARSRSTTSLGAVIWVGVCVSLGYLFGNVPIVKKNFTLVMLGIVFVSVLPAVYEVVKHRRTAK